MKYALVSDIHANLAAWNAVLLDIRSVGVDRIICLGDIVGYGPQPLEVLESLYSNVDHFVLGNHDAALCGKINPDLFTEPACGIIKWTAERLGDSARRFLARLPLSLAGQGFRCAHANFDLPADFHYVFDPQDAVPGWNAVPEPLLFIGHTHQPGIFVIGQSRTPRLISPEDFMLEDGKRFLVNVGSVGQPRDGDYRASYCIYDSASAAVFWRKITFDLDAHRLALHKAGLPLDAAPFLNSDPRTQQQPLRERVDFSPPTEPVAAMRDTLAVQNLDQLKQRVHHWQIMFVALLALLLLAAGVVGWSVWRHKQRRLFLPGIDMQVVRSTDLAPNSNFMEFPASPVTPNQSMRGWDMRLDNHYRQQIAWRNLADGTAGFEMISDDRRSECRVISPSIHVKSGGKLMMRAYFKKSTDFQGSAALVVELTRRASASHDGLSTPEYEVTHNFRVKEPNQIRAGGWLEARETFDLPANSHAVRLKIGGKFHGTVLVRDVRLECPR